MASATLIPVSEYLNTTYRPDRDYIDGEVKERNLGDRPHAAMQAILTAIFNNNRRLWNVVALTEQRVQTSAKHFRIPDICVLRRSDPVDPIVHVAPLICVEILSPRDSLSDMQERVDDYFQMGVTHVWVIDPRNRRAYVASTKGFQEPENAQFSVPETPVRISIADVFAEFDEMQSQTGL
jgi:Uma2 family endonuclease